MNPANISAGYGRVKSDREVEGVIREGYSAGALAMVTQNDWCAVQRLLLSRESRSHPAHKTLREVDWPTKGGRPNAAPQYQLSDGADGYLTSSISSTVG